jgi:hypothetical protein
MESYIVPGVRHAEPFSSRLANSQGNIVWFNDTNFAERLARAFRHAVEVCGGKPPAV